MANVATSHRVATYADVLVGDTVIEQGIPISGGSVSFDAQAKTRGKCTITVPDPAYAPLLVTDRLSVGGTELQVYRTVDDTEFSLGVFRIDDAQVTDDGSQLSTTVTAYDRSRTVSRARLETAKVLTSGTNYITAITDLVAEAIPHVEVISTPTTRTTPLLVLDAQSDRWEICLRLAEAIGFVCYFDQFGRLNLTPEPTPNGPPTATISDGTGGVLVSAGLRWSVDGVYNAVIATGDGPNGPVFGAAYDLDPTSVTFWEGPFGKVPRFYASELLGSDAQAAEAAQGILSRVIGIPRSVTFSMVPDPSLFPGRVVRIERETLGVVENHLLDQVSIPLSVEAAATAATRTQTVA